MKRPVLLTAVLLLFCTGCPDSGSDARRRIQSNRRRSQTVIDDFDSAFNFITEMHQFEPRQSATQASYHLNKWINGRKPPEDWRLDPLLDRIPSGLKPLYDAKPLTRQGFTINDVFYIEGCNLMSKAAVWGSEQADPRLQAWLDANEEGLSDDELDQLTVAQRLFDWTVRNVQLDPTPPPPAQTAAGPGVEAESQRPSQQLKPGPGYVYLPRQGMMFGHGDKWVRSRIFIALARQRGIDVAVLAIDPTRGQIQPWLTAVRIGKRLYLFDPELGIPIPTADGRGVATLEDARKDPAVLGQLKAGEDKYSVTPKDLERILVMIDASPEAVSSRMRTLESALTGDRRMVLSIHPSEMATAFRQCAGIANVAVWTVPLDAVYFQRNLEERFDEQDMSVAKYAVERLVVDGVNPVVNGRRLHLRGRFESNDEQEPSAKQLYMSFRVDNETLAKFRTDARVQKMLGLTRGPRETDAQWGSRLAGAELQFRKGKENSSYWIALVHLEMNNYEAAADWFANRIVKANERGTWSAGARYNLARVHEAEGEYESARRILLTDDSPQSLGNRIRARLLREWNEAKAAENPGEGE